jgi:predicted branched-subunit amino acid permease
VSTIDAGRAGRQSPADVIGGLLAMASLVLSGIAMGLGLLLELEARPVRTAAAAILLALVASLMTQRHRTLALVAALVAALAWVVGLTIAVITENPLF